MYRIEMLYSTGSVGLLKTKTWHENEGWELSENADEKKLKVNKYKEVDST